MSQVDIFNVFDGTWSHGVTQGPAPLGVYGYGCARIGNSIYYFGGWCGHKDCYHNSLCQLNVETLQWTQVSPTSDEEGLPMKKCISGVVSFSSNDDDIVFVVGGSGRLANMTEQPHSNYIIGEDGDVTDEQHMYNISTSECGD